MRRHRAERPTRSKAWRPAALSAWDQTRVNGHAAIIVLSTHGLDKNGRERLAAYVRQGGGVLIAASDEIDSEVIASALGDQRLLTFAPPAAAKGEPPPRRLTPADLRHPIFKAFGSRVAALGLVRFQRVAVIESAACPALARFTSGEIGLAECAVGEGRAVILAFDLGRRDNDFPLQSSFVPFLHETVRYLAAGRTAAETYVIGEGRAAQVERPGIVALERSAGGSQGPALRK